MDCVFCFLNSALFPSSVHAAVHTFSSLLLTAAQESQVCIRNIFIYTFPLRLETSVPPASCPTRQCPMSIFVPVPRGSRTNVCMIIAGIGVLGHRTHTDEFQQVLSEWL